MQRYTFAFLWPEKHYQCKGRKENYTAIPLLSLTIVVARCMREVGEHIRSCISRVRRSSEHGKVAASAAHVLAIGMPAPASAAPDRRCCFHG
jgi:hypothetical protein